MPKNAAFFLLFLLGALSAFGPLVTDMYLPTMPAMVRDYHTTQSLVQAGLSSSFIGLALGQIFIGPLSDKYGRRPLLLVSMFTFLVSTLGVIFSPDIYWFIGFRLLQGLAGAGGVVISRSVATDSFSGKELATAMAIIGAINGIVPVAAPIVGGWCSNAIGWRGIFWILLICGVGLTWSCLHFRETLAPTDRTQDGVRKLFLGFGRILQHAHFTFYVALMGFTYGALFVNISSSSFIVEDYYGFSAFGFSLVFALNAVSIGIASGLSAKFRRPEHSVFWGCTLLLIFSSVECLALLTGADFWLYESLLFVIMFSIGLIFPPTTALAMDLERQNSGTASALIGAVGFTAGGLVTPLVGLGNMLTTTGLMFLACALGAFLFMIFAVPRSQRISQCIHCFGAPRD